MTQIKFAPKEIFDQILEWAVIPTFDLILTSPSGVVLVKRKIAPYQNQWALPGLRMYKGENIDDTLKRIAQQEVGIEIDPVKKVFIGQYVGKFKTEHERQDISTCYTAPIEGNQDIILNTEHFTSYVITKEIPKGIGAMYKFYIEQFIRTRSRYGKHTNL